MYDIFITYACKNARTHLENTRLQINNLCNHFYETPFSSYNWKKKLQPQVRTWQSDIVDWVRIDYYLRCRYVDATTGTYTQDYKDIS